MVELNRKLLPEACRELVVALKKIAKKREAEERIFKVIERENQLLLEYNRR